MFLAEGELVVVVVCVSDCVYFFAQRLGGLGWKGGFVGELG